MKKILVYMLLLFPFVLQAQINAGSYIIKLAATMKALDAARPQMNTNGGTVQLWDACADYRVNCEPQLWEIIDAGAGLYKIRLSATQKLLTSDGGNTTGNGTAVTIWDECAGCNNQLWRITALGGNRFTIKSLQEKALDADRAQMNTNGGRIQLWDPCTNTGVNCEPQVWTVYAVNNVLDVAMSYPLNGPIAAMAVDPWNSQHIVLAAESGGLFETINAGAASRRWTHLDEFKVHEIQDVLITPERTDFKLLVAASNSFSNEGGVLLWKRNITGDWSKVSFETGVTSGRTYRIVQEQFNRRNIYACGDYGLAVIPADGSPAQIRTLDNKAIYSVEVLRSGRIIAATRDGIYYSNNEGRYWSLGVRSPAFTDAGDKFCLTTDAGKNIALAFRPAEGNQFTLFSSEDGWTWNQFNTNLITNFPGAGGLKSVTARTEIGLTGEVKLSVFVSNQFQISYASQTGSSVQSIITDMQRNAALVWHGDALNEARVQLDAINVGHTDTRQIAFLTNGVTTQKMVVTSDGGFHIANITSGLVKDYNWQTERTNSGLKCLDVTTVTGNATQCYFGTWHDGFGLTSDFGRTITSSFGAEGWVLSKEGIHTIAAAGTVTQNYNPATLIMPGPVMSNAVFGIGTASAIAWNNPPASSANGGPVYLRESTSIQQAFRTASAVNWPWKITANAGANWQDYTTCAFPRFGIHLSSIARDPSTLSENLYLTVDDRNTIKLAKLANPLSAGVHMFTYPALTGLDGGIAQINFGNGVTAGVFSVNPLNANQLLASEAVTGMLKRSTNGGTRWDPVTSFNNLYSNGSTGTISFKSNNGYNGITCISYSPFQDGVVLAGTLTEGLFLSKNNGVAWRKLNNPGVLCAFSFHWFNASTVMLGTYGRGLFKIEL